jgi:hypothetical protein
MNRNFIWLDAVFAFVALMLLCVVCATGICKPSLFLCFLWGFLIGYSWELSHALIPGFIRLVDTNLEAEFPTKTFYPIVHAVWDSLILLIGLFWVHLAKMPVFSACALALIWCWSMGLEVLVELLFNGRVWHYNETFKYNPVLFRIGQTGYTMWPYLEWMIAPILFWIGVVFIRSKLD